MSFRETCVLSNDADSFQGWFIPAINSLTDPSLDAKEDDLGQELDLWYDYYMTEHLSFGVEFTIFMPGDAITQLQSVTDFDTLIAAPLPDHTPTMLANQSTILGDDPAIKLTAQVRLRY